MNIFPFMMIATAKKERRKQLAEALLPAMLPVADESQRVLFNTVTADQQVRSAERAESRTASETATAVTLAARKETAVLTDDELNQLPTLKKVIARAPDVRALINSNAQSIQQQAVAESTALAEETVALVELAIGKSKDTKLTVEELSQTAPRLQQRLRPEWLDRIVANPPGEVVDTG